MRKATRSRQRETSVAAKAPASPPSTPNPEPPTAAVPVDVEQFLALYIANGFNASAAYREIHPAVTDPTARTNGWRLLTKADVKARLAELLKDRWKDLHMTGDEVLGRVALDARCDPRMLFDEHGKLLPPHLWPDDLANSIESVKVKDDGIEVRLASKTAARRTILEVTGKVKGGDSVDQLAEAMRATLEKAIAR